MDDTIFRETLVNIPVLDEIEKLGLIDLAMITGSYARGEFDNKSDIDLFIVLPLAVEQQYGLLPEYSFELQVDANRRLVEVSFVTTEKLTRDQTSKSHIFWWHDARLVFIKDQSVHDMFIKAASYSEAEWHDTLWTLNFQFKLGMYDFAKAVDRAPEDVLRMSIVYYDCLRIFMECLLLSKDIVRRFTGYIQHLRSVEPEFAAYLDTVSSDIEMRQAALDACSQRLDQALLEAGFDRSEVVEWNKHNLTRLTFQK